ncbi:MAG: dockerin type I repeat-containing protein [Prevotella sp.]
MNYTFFHKLSFLMLFLCSALVAQAENKVYIDNMTVIPGEEATVSVLLDNTDNISSLQFDMTLSEGLTYVENSTAKCLDRVKRSSHNLQVKPVETAANTQTYRVVLLSNATDMSKSAIAGNNGAIVTFKMTVDAKFKQGMIQISNVWGSDATQGDVKELKMANTYAFVAPYIGEATLGVDAIELKAGEPALIPFNLANDVDVVGMQAVVTLPAGVTIAEDEDGEVVEYTDRLSGNTTVVATKIGDNSWKLLVSSLTADPFSLNEGTLFSLRVQSDETFTEAGEISVSDIRVSIPNGTSYVIADKPLTVAVAPAPTTEPEDVNGDGRINMFDVYAVFEAIADEAETPCPADINGDGRINMFDVYAIFEKMAE